MLVVTEKANAKINLFLSVTERRKDGYHNIESVMHSVDLFDVVSIEIKKADEKKITVKTSARELCDEKSNLVYLAAQKYLSKYMITDEVVISLIKNIPIGAGLGGGSADAAATLRALRRIYKKGSLSELLSIALSVGSDVPFCLLGGTALCGGRGEKITPVPVEDKMHFALATGGERVSTPLAFAELDRRYSVFPSKAEMCGNMICALRNGTEISSYVYNVFEDITGISDVEKIKKHMIKSGAECALMSGSGPAVFGIFKTKEAAEAAVCALLSVGFSAFYAESVSEEYINLDGSDI